MITICPVIGFILWLWPETAPRVVLKTRIIDQWEYG